jgi:hypothetical protein
MLMVKISNVCHNLTGQDSAVGIATRYGLDGPAFVSRWGLAFLQPSNGPWGPSSFLYNGHRVFFSGVQRSGRGVDHPFYLAPRLKSSYTSTSPLGLHHLFPGRTLPFTLFRRCHKPFFLCKPKYRSSVRYSRSVFRRVHKIAESDY